MKNTSQPHLTNQDAYLLEQTESLRNQLGRAAVLGNEAEFAEILKRLKQKVVRLKCTTSLVKRI